MYGHVDMITRHLTGENLNFYYLISVFQALPTISFAWHVTIVDEVNVEMFQASEWISVYPVLYVPVERNFSQPTLSYWVGADFCFFKLFKLFLLKSHEFTLLDLAIMVLWVNKFIV